MSVEGQVLLIVAEQFGVPEKNLRLDLKLSDDLGGDSLDALELVTALEDAFGVEITEEAAAAVSTVGQLVELVKREVALRGEVGE